MKSVKIIHALIRISKKMNKRLTVNVSTNIHNERIKADYIPSYISENGV